MVAVVQDKVDAIADLCRKYGVVRLHIFGSATRDDFRPGESDLDLLVDFGAMFHEVLGRARTHHHWRGSIGPRPGCA